MRKILASLLFLFMAAPAFAASTPHATLMELGEATENADADKFARAADIDAIILDCLNRLPPLLQSANAGSLLGTTLSALNGPGGKYARDIIKNEARAFVLNGVASGAFGGKKTGAPSRGGMLAPLFANASMGKKEIRGVGEGRGDGDDWLLPFSVHDYGADADYAIVGRFSPTSEGYRLTRVENLEDLVGQIVDQNR